MDNSKCFDYGDFVAAREIEANIGTYLTGIVPTLMDNILMRYYSDNNQIRTEMVKILRSKMFYRDLQIKGPMTTTSPLYVSVFIETRALFWRERRKVTQALKTI